MKGTGRGLNCYLYIYIPPLLASFFKEIPNDSSMHIQYFPDTSHCFSFIPSSSSKNVLPIFAFCPGLRLTIHLRCFELYQKVCSFSRVKFGLKILYDKNKNKKVFGAFTCDINKSIRLIDFPQDFYIKTSSNQQTLNKRMLK